jgi:hypothetical protein
MITAAMLSTFNSEPCRDTLQAAAGRKKVVDFFFKCEGAICTDLE